MRLRTPIMPGTPIHYLRHGRAAEVCDRLYSTLHRLVRLGLHPARFGRDRSGTNRRRLW